jgi:hypothetical protein
MEKSFSRRRLIVDLLRRGVSPAYACRVTRELAEHSEDLAESGLDTPAGVGDVELLAAGIAETYRKRTFAGRHPILSFAVAPFPLLIAAIVGFWTVGVLIVLASVRLTNYWGFVAVLLHPLSMFVPAMTITWLVCRLARGAGLTWQRAVLACLPILAVAFLFNSVLQLNDWDGEGHGALMFGINLPLGPLFGPAFGKPGWGLPMVWTPLARVALPLCVMLWMFLRERALADAVLLENGESRDDDTCDPRPLAAREAA